MVFVKMNDGFQRILMKHVLYVEAGGSYCSLHVHGTGSILVPAPLARVSIPMSKFMKKKVPGSLNMLSFSK